MMLAHAIGMGATGNAGILGRAVAHWRVAEYGGSGPLLDGRGNGRDMALPGGSNDPLFLAYDGSVYAHFPGTAGNNVTVAGLSNSTIYDYTVTYKDATTADGTATSDGSGNLVLGEAQSDFSLKSVTDITVVPDGGGAEVAGADFTSIVEPFAAFTGRQALTWTINRTATARKMALVDRPTFLFGVDDYLTTPDHADLDFAAGQDWTVVVAKRQYHFATVQAFIAKKSNLLGGNAGWMVYMHSTGTCRTMLGDGANLAIDQASALSAGLASSCAARCDRAGDDDLEAYLDGVGSGSPASTSAVGDASNALALEIGRTGDGSSYLEGEFFGAAVFREALTAAEIISVAEALKGR